MDKAALMKRIKSDKRSKEELFEAICDGVRRASKEAGSPVPPDDEVKEGAHRLIQFCTFLVESAVERDMRNKPK